MKKYDQDPTIPTTVIIPVTEALLGTKTVEKERRQGETVYYYAWPSKSTAIG